MTTLGSGLNTVNRAWLCACQGAIYYTNCFDSVQVWYGLSAALQQAGITASSVILGAATSSTAGGFTNGDHLMRYRYKNSKTGYVSNPAPALTVTISGGNGIQTYGIGAAAAIRTTTDPKVDLIVFEVTPVGGGTFYQAGTAANATGSIVVGMVDESLIQQFNSDAAYGSSTDLETYSSEVPPICAIMVPYRGRMWYLGDAPYALTGVTFTNGSANVTGTGFSLRWAGRVITKSGDTVSYQILSVGSSTALTLTTTYGGTGSTSAATVVSATPNRGYYSRLFFPEQCFAAVWARDFLPEKSDLVTAAIGRTDGLWVFGKNNAERLIFNADPSAAAGAVIDPIKGKRGAFHQRVLCDIEGEIYVWDRQGMWIVGAKPVHISGRIDKLLEQYIDYSQSVQFHVNFEPINRIAKFFFVPSGGTSPTMRACFEIDTGRWSFESSLQGITSSQIVPTSDGQVRLMLGDENGYSWYDGVDDAFDGTPPASPTVVTVSSGASTTVFPVTQTLPIVAPTLAGVMCYNPVTGESKYITANTASTITINGGFAAAPAALSELYLGPILFSYTMKWWVGEDQATRKDPLYFLLKLFPGSDTGVVRIYFYSKFSNVPSPITAFPTDTWPDGVVPPTSGQYYIEANLDGGDGDGVLSIPVPIEWEDAVRAVVTSVRPDGDLRFLDMQFVTTKRGEATDVGT